MVFGRSSTVIENEDLHYVVQLLVFFKGGLVYIIVAYLRHVRIVTSKHAPAITQ
jgi:hypothetical protein